MPGADARRARLLAAVVRSQTTLAFAAERQVIGQTMRFAQHLLIAGFMTGTAASCDSPSSCAAPSGTYEVVHVEVDGNCGAVPARVVEAWPERVTAFNPPCDGTVQWSDDFCQTTLDATCPREDVGSGFYERQHSESQLSQDASIRTGTDDVTIFRPDGSAHCRSTYSVTATRRPG
jgi:hypothetical protein